MSNREKLLTCALDLFSKRGFDAVGVQEVASLAGLKKPTLYHYFGSKSGLLRTLLTENFAALFDEVEKAADYHGDVTMTLRSVASVYFEYARQNPKLYRLQLSMWFAPSDSEAFKIAAGLNLRQQEIIENMFLRASADHGNMKGRHRAYAATFLGLINTYASLGLNGFTKLNQALVNNAVHQFMHGIFS
ncbi:MAG: TetR/AcrR family transcriptional regulator [Anaerolineales bacterium]